MKPYGRIEGSKICECFYCGKTPKNLDLKKKARQKAQKELRKEVRQHFGVKTK